MPCCSRSRISEIEVTVAVGVFRQSLPIFTVNLSRARCENCCFRWTYSVWLRPSIGHGNESSLIGNDPEQVGGLGLELGVLGAHGTHGLVCSVGSTTRLRSRVTRSPSRGWKLCASKPSEVVVVVALHRPRGPRPKTVPLASHVGAVVACTHRRPSRLISHGKSEQ